MKRKSSSKGVSSVFFAFLIGIIFTVLAVIIGLNMWHDVIWQDCWYEANEQMDKLCLGGGFECDAPSTSKSMEHTIRLGSCVHSVFIIEKEKAAQALMSSGHGNSGDCEWTLDTFIVLVPKDRGIVDISQEALNVGLLEAVRQASVSINCKGYLVELQGDSYELRGPGSKPFVEYCVTVKKVAAATDTTKDKFEILVNKGAC